MQNRPVLAIDIGSTKVACALGFRSPSRDGSFEVAASGISQYPDLSCSWPCDVPMLSRAIENALKQMGPYELPQKAWVSFNHPNASHLKLSANIDISDEPMMIRTREVRRLSSIVASQAQGLDRHLVMLEPVCYRGNGFDDVKDPRGLVATRLGGDFIAVTIPMSVMAVLNQALDLVGVEARRYLYGIQSMAEFVFKGSAAKAAPYSYNTSSPSSDQTQTQRSLLVDVGGCCMDLAILERSRIVKSLTLDWGSMHIASDIAKEVRCSVEQAVTISLEGQSSPRAIVKQVLENRMNMLHNGLHEFMEGENLPDSLFITGRGALIDGVAESIGNLMELKPVICKSLLSSRFSDLSSQIAISNAIGSLEVAFSSEKPSRPWPSGLVDGVIERTKTILIDYF